MNEKEVGLGDALKVVTSLVNPKELAFSSSQKGKLVITGITNEGSCLFRSTLEAPDGLDNSLMFETSAILSAIKGRQGVKLAIENGALTIKSKGYTATLASTETPAQEEMFQAEEGALEVPTKGDAWDWIAKIISTIKLTHIESSPTMLFVRVNAEGAFACAYNTYQMKFSKSSKVTSKKTLEFTLPLIAAKRIGQSAFVGDALHIGKSSIVFSSASAKAKLPTFEPELQVTGDQLYDMAVTIPKMKGVSIELDKTQLLTFLENSSYLTGPQSSIQFAAEEGKVTVSCLTSSGSTKAQFKADVAKSVKFSMRTSIIMDALDSKEEKIAITYTQSSIVIKQGAFLYRAAVTEPE